MRQPKVKLFGKTYKVSRIEWNNETGEIDNIVYYYPDGDTNIIFEYKYIDYGHETKELTEPMTQPHDGHIGVPNIKEILI